MPNPEIVAAGEACDANLQLFLDTLQKIAAGGPLQAMGSADELLALIVRGSQDRRRYSDLVRAHIDALEDRIAALEAARG